MKQGKGVIRKLNRSATASGKLHPAELRRGREAEPTMCERCGATLTRRVWHRPSQAKPTHAFFERVSWAICPACTQVEREEYLGRITIDGDVVRSDGDAIRRRIHNVAERAEYTQVEHRVVSLDEVDGKLVVLTTSQKLAHRIVHELKKAFGGRASYQWLDDGCLEARWSATTRRAAAGA